MRAVIAMALLAAACSAEPTEWKRERPASPAASTPSPPPVAASPSDPLSRADQIAAEAAKREAEYQQSVEEAKKPRTDVPVVTEFSPQGASAAAYSAAGGDARPEEAWWRAQMDPLREEWHRQDAAFGDANDRWNAASKMRNGPEKDALVKKAIADQRRAQAASTRASQAAAQLREKAKQMGVPMEWVSWP